MIDIFVPDEFAAHADAGLLEKAAAAALRHEDVVVDEAELSIVIDGDERLQELNRQFLGVDAPTDVLSFPADEHDPDTGLRYLGDIIISFPTAQKQAEKAGAAIEDELQLLVIHGILHLLGHDHAGAEEKVRMWTAQAEVLQQLGITLKQLPE